MRIHVLTDPVAFDLGPLNVFSIGPRAETVLAPGGDAPLEVELELMVRLEPGETLLLAPHPRTRFTLGLRAALPQVLRNHQDGVGSLRFWFEPPAAAVTLRVGEPLVEAVLLNAPLARYYHDITLPDALKSAFPLMEGLEPPIRG